MFKKVKSLFVLLALGTFVNNSIAQTTENNNIITRELDSLSVKKFSDTENSIILTLDDALTVALSDNPQIKIADKEITKTNYAKKGTYASLFPLIEASGSYQRTVKKQTMYMDLGETTQAIEIGTNNTFTGGFGASMPLVSPTLWESLKISGLDVELAIEQARSSKISMVEQVSKAYYSVLLAIDTYNVYVDTYNNSLENYLIVKQKYNVGSTSEYEMIRANVQAQNILPSLYSAQHSIALTKWQLKALLGMDLETDIACSGSLLDYVSQMTTPKEDINLDNNSDLQQLEIQKQLLNSALRMSKAENYPSLALSFDYNWIAMDDTYKFSSYKWNPYGIITLGLSVPIFNGGKRRHNIQQARINIDQLELQKEDAVKNLEVAWLQYNNAMDISMHQYDVAKSTVEQAKKGYEIATERYKVGKGTQLEVKDSQLQLVEAELSKNSAIYDYLTAQISLQALSSDL
ncbi:MAG: TolC family protein [Rikenellaceae bacterium]